MKHIYRKLFIRLGVSGLLLSVIFGWIVYLIETEQIDMEVVALIQADTNHLITTAKSGQSIDDVLKSLSVSSEHLLNNHLVVVEVYNRQKEKIAEFQRPDKDIVENVLKKYDHTFPLKDKVIYKKFYVGQGLYLQALIPLKLGADQTVGYFEGVYQVEDSQLKQIFHRLQFTVAQTIIVVFATTILLTPIIFALNRDLIRYSSKLVKANTDVLSVLGGAISKRDTDTCAHNYRVTIYAVKIAERIQLNTEEIQKLIKGAFVHDVGKIAISDNILLKPGKLTQEEFEVMKTHVSHGVDIVKQTEWLQDGIDVVAYHHEKFDGSGYLHGTSGEQIPLNARIFAIADVFDALTSKRPYKEPFPLEKAIDILKEGRGTHFDPYLVDEFLLIAAPLYKQLSHMEEEMIELSLSTMIKKYFYDQM